MSDQPSEQQGALPELTLEQEESVRRLLADARHDEPIPAEVAARLDTTLAGLTRDEPGSPGVAPVLDLAARRRRRNAAGLLAGAAAVIVSGFVGGQLIDVGSSGDDAGTASTEADANRAGSADDQAGGDSLESFSPGATAPLAGSGGPVLQLRSQHLASDLDTQLRSYASEGSASASLSASELGALGCTTQPPPQKFGLGEFFPALFDGTPAVVALRAPADGTQTADVLECSSAELLDSVTLTPR
ncbi:hypothetical protein [Nocardioides halotolerans]|jgi:hypothetical protein|uniref:hypothetical protein n=1 Tax=Nocardioides halotolerans TaxID=433660 RepID=UPI0003FFC7F5|nr:hypothetical protein [Nocardioides halotolerans]